MAGTIAADTLTHSTAGSLTTDYVVNGSSKQWINFNGTGTISIRDSFNTTSITDNSTGNYTVTLTNAMANSDWSAFLLAALDDSAGGIYTNNPDIFSSASGSYGVGTYNNSNFADLAFIRSGLLGDLA